MKNSIKILLIIEIQLILLLLIFLIVKMDTLDKKIYNTNKFVHEVMTDERIEVLNTIKNNDIIIGEVDAPVSIFLYSRFDCPACNSFFKDNYERLKSEYVDNGKVNLVVRYLVHKSKPKALYFTKCAYYAKQKGFYNSFIQKIDSIYPVLDSTIVKNIMIGLVKDENNFKKFIDNTTIEKELLHSADVARKTGVRHTPTIFINNQRLIGNRKYEKLKNIILAEFDTDVCD